MWILPNCYISMLCVTPENVLLQNGIFPIEKNRIELQCSAVLHEQRKYLRKHDDNHNAEQQLK